MAVHFADTSFWVALVDRRDALHLTANACAAAIEGRIITTEAVL
jgi:predicted nucleic acid-binding protein